MAITPVGKDHHLTRHLNRAGWGINAPALGAVHTLVDDEHVSIFELTRDGHSIFYVEFATDGERLDINPTAWTWTLGTVNLEEIVDETLLHLYNLAARVQPLLRAPSEYERKRGYRRAVSLRQSIDRVAKLAGRTITVEKVGA